MKKAAEISQRGTKSVPIECREDYNEEEIIKSKELKTDIDFLRNFYEFFVKKHGTNVNFEEKARETLVNSEQIAEESLQVFVDEKNSEAEIILKRRQIENHEKKISDLRQELNNLCSNKRRVV